MTAPPVTAPPVTAPIVSTTSSPITSVSTPPSTANLVVPTTTTTTVVGPPVPIADTSGSPAGLLLAVGVVAVLAAVAIPIVLRRRGEG